MQKYVVIHGLHAICKTCTDDSHYTYYANPHAHIMLRKLQTKRKGVAITKKTPPKNTALHGNLKAKNLS